MEKEEQMPIINMMNNDDIEENANISYQESSHTIIKKDLHQIQSIILGLDNTSFKPKIKDEIECFYSQINNCSESKEYF